MNRKLQERRQKRINALQTRQKMPKVYGATTSNPQNNNNSNVMIYDAPTSYGDNSRFQDQNDFVFR